MACLCAGRVSVVIVGFAGCTVIQPPPDFTNPPSAADVTFNEISQRYLAEMLPLTPVRATSLGDHRYDGQLDDVSADGQLAESALPASCWPRWKPWEFRNYPAPPGRCPLLKSELDSVVWSVEELQEWRWNPLIYTDLAGNSIYLLMARDFAPLPVRLRNVGSRLSELPRLLMQVRESLDPARVPRIHAETAVKQNTGVLSLIDELVVPSSGHFQKRSKRN